MAKKSLILVVDDVEDNLRLIGKNLQELDGVDISFATSGDQTLRLLKKITPDLILLDILMPGIDGFDLCRKIVSNNRLNSIPILFLSAKASMDDIITGFAAGGKDYLTKPFIKEELLARVKTHLEIKRNNDKMEQLVRKRTAELRAINDKLCEYNTALRVMLEKKDEIRAELDDNVTESLKVNCLPMIKRLKSTPLKAFQKQLLDDLERGLMAVTLPYAKNTEAALLRHKLTDKELEMAKLVIQGRSIKEMADLANCSESTVNFHRINIRQKLGIKNKKVNLWTFLKSMEQGLDPNAD